jgi:hypothetical protein
VIRRAVTFTYIHTYIQVLDVDDSGMLSNVELSHSHTYILTYIHTYIQVLDIDDSGTLTYVELAEGLKKLKVKPTIHLSEEDFDAMTNLKELCDEHGELGAGQFDKVCMYLCMYACMHLFLHECMYVCTCDEHGELGAGQFDKVCMYVCMYVCMQTYICIHISEV